MPQTETVIRQALKEKVNKAKTDRNYYQLDRDMVDHFIGLVECVPDHTFLFDIDPRISLKRVDARGEKDRFEQEEIAFHDRVRAAYLEAVDRDPDRFTVISVGDKTDRDVFHEVSNKLDELIT